jgi:glutamine amidotransferase-like uncharacterized protein
MKTNLAKSLLTLILLAAGAQAHAAPLALIYKGDGACWPCINGAAKMASLAGFDVQMVDADLRDFSVLERAQLWIQPGGKSVTAAKTMGPELVGAVRRFVEQGGGYVGFCAGGFMSTETIGTSGYPGLGIVAGSTTYHVVEDDAAYRMEKVWTPDGDRSVFFAGGPQFVVSDEALQAVQGRVTARTEDGSQILALEAHYGQGKVAVSGFHPEASALWKGERLFVSGPHGYLRTGVEILDLLMFPVTGPAALVLPFAWKSPYFSLDQDGDDYDFAVGMIRYATSH